MSWQEVSLGEFLRNREERFKANDEKVRTLKRIDKIDFAGQLLLSEKQSKTDMILVKKDDLVISGINVEKGAMTVYEGEEDIAATIHYSSYYFDNDKIDIDFIKLYLKSTKFKNAIKEQVPGGIKTEIKPKHLLPLKIVIPTSIKEQSHIVREFKFTANKIIKLTHENFRQLEILQKLRKQIIKDAVQGNLVNRDSDYESASVFSERIKGQIEKFKKKNSKKQSPLNTISDEIPFDISDKSLWYSLGEVCEIEKGNLGITKAVPGEYPLVVLAEKRLSHNDYQFNCKGVIIPLISSTGHGHASMKRIHYQEGKFSVGSILCCVYPKVKGMLNEKFLFTYLDMFKEEFFVSKMKGAANVSLKISSIGETPIPLIPIKIQNKIEIILQSLEMMERSIKQNQKLSQQLLQSALKEALEPK